MSTTVTDNFLEGKNFLTKCSKCLCEAIYTEEDVKKRKNDEFDSEYVFYLECPKCKNEFILPLTDNVIEISWKEFLNKSEEAFEYRQRKRLEPENKMEKTEGGKLNV